VVTADKTYPKHLRRMVDFCCDRLGCGHHVDGHGYGNDCQVPGCDCQGWRDHTVCDHRQMDEVDPAAEVERLRASMLGMADGLDSYADTCRETADRISMRSLARQLRTAVES
jgi:hypothetical protein